MSAGFEPNDPFAMTAGADCYVPRAATEVALDELERALRGGRQRLALTGPPGIGKSLLLHLLEARIADSFRVVYAPYAALDARELCAWVLGALGQRGEASAEELVNVALRLHAQGSGLLILLDDVASMPLDTARRLAEIASRAEGALCYVAACADDARSTPVLEALGTFPEPVRLCDPMSAKEIEHYVRARLERAHASHGMQERFDAAAMRLLQRETGGIPRVVNTVADEIVRADAGALPVVAAPRPPVLAHRDAVPARGDASAAPRSRARDHAGEPPRSDAARRPVPAPAAPSRRSHRGGLAAALGVTALLGAALWLRFGMVPAPLPEPPDATTPEPRARAASARLEESTWPAPPLVPEPVRAETPPEPAPEDPPEQPDPPESATTFEPVEAAALAPDSAPVDPVAPIEPSAQPPAPTAQPVDAEIAPSAASDAADPPAEVSVAPAIPEAVAVNFNARPWAEIAVDGSSVGETPIAGVRLAPGRHRVRVTYPDGRVEEHAIEVSEQKRHFAFGP